MQEILVIEERLCGWKRSLPEKLLLRPWADQETSRWSSPQHHPIFARLSVVAQLRYLNVRILLHRPILNRLLQRRQPAPGSESAENESKFAEEMRKSSVTVCQDSAMEIIDIVHRVSGSATLLGAWWFSIYYSESP